MFPTNADQQAIERLYDFAHLGIRILHVYEEVRAATTRQLLLGELHQQLRWLNGAGQANKFKPHLALFSRLLLEIPSEPEHVEASIACLEQLIWSIEQSVLSRSEGNAASSGQVAKVR